MKKSTVWGLGLVLSLFVFLSACQQGVTEKALSKEAAEIEVSDESLADFAETQAFAKLSEVLADTSRPGMSEACRAMRSQMRSAQEEHKNLHDELKESQRHLRLCMMNKSDKTIGEGACEHWESHAESVRERQQALYERFMSLQQEMERACQN